MSRPISKARALLASRDETACFAGYPDRKLADAMRELLAEVGRMQAEEARCIDAADAATREDERRHAEFVKAAMERERRLEAERDAALRRGRLEGAASVKAEALSRILAERSQGDPSFYTHGTWDQGASAAASTVELIDLAAIVAALEAQDAG